MLRLVHGLVSPPDGDRGGEVPDPNAHLKNSFGRIAIAQGWASPGQVDDSLKTTQKLAELGFREKLGAVMVKKGYLTAEQVNEILVIQGRRARNRIKGYEILSKLGQGGMGAVFKARQLSLDRPVALKILSPEFARDRAYVQRFLREARAVARLSHPNVIQGIDIGECDGNYYFAMEFVDGPTLAEMVRSGGALPEERALKFTEDIGRALMHAQRHGLVHRDIKPDNIMIARGRDAKLCDLGLAKFTGSDPSLSTVDGERMVMGTPHYIAPEQARGEAGVDTRSDIYSLGGSLFFAITGRTPFEGDNAAAIMAMHVTDLVTDPREIKPGISEGAVLLLGRMMAKRPDDRYARAKDLVDDIGALRKGRTPEGLARPGARLGIRIRRAGADRPAGEVRPKPGPRAAPTAHTPAARRIVRRGRRGLERMTERIGQKNAMRYVVYAVGALIVFAVVMWLLPARRGSGNDERPAPAPPRKDAASGGKKPGPGADVPSPGPDASKSEGKARAALERAREFAGRPANADDFPGILARLDEAGKLARGTGLEDEVKGEREKHLARQAALRERRLRELVERAQKLAFEGRFREAARLAGEFPEELVAGSGETAEAVLAPVRRAVEDAARARFRNIVALARANAAEGRYDQARGTLSQAETIEVDSVKRDLVKERAALEKMIRSHRAGTDADAEGRWRARRGEITALAGRAEYDAAVDLAREALADLGSSPSRAEAEALFHDMSRAKRAYDLALGGYASRAGKRTTVTIHKGERSYRGRVVRVDGNAISIRPRGKGPGDLVVVRKSELAVDDIKRHASLVGVEGAYDLGVLLLHSGDREEAKVQFSKCVRDPKLGARARRHLESLGRDRPQPD